VIGPFSSTEQGFAASESTDANRWFGLVSYGVSNFTIDWPASMKLTRTMIAPKSVNARATPGFRVSTSIEIPIPACRTGIDTDDGGITWNFIVHGLDLVILSPASLRGQVDDLQTTVSHPS
jgi:hypothetical protein